MPININFPDFLRAPIQQGPFANLAKDLREGYQTGLLPSQMRRKAEQEQLAIALAQMQNKYYPQLQEQALQKGDIDIQSGQLDLSAKPRDIELRQLHNQLVNQTSQKNLNWIDPLNQSRLDLNEANIEKARNPQNYFKPTNEQKNLASLGITPDNPQYDEYMRSLTGLPSNRAIPPGTRDLRGKNVNDQLDAVKRMRNIVSTYPNVKQVQNNIKEMRAIVEKNPRIAGTLAAAFIDPTNPGIASVLASWGTSKKDRADIEKIQKLSADINLQELGTFGANVSDARQNLISKTKASPAQTKESFLYVLDKLEKQKEPYELYVQAVKSGLQNDYEVFADPEAFRVENMTDEQLDFWEKELQKGKK